MSRHIRFLHGGITISGSGDNRVMLWRGTGRDFRHWTIRTPINLSAHSWRYAIRNLGFWRAVMARGFVRRGVA